MLWIALGLGVVWTAASVERLWQLRRRADRAWADLGRPLDLREAAVARLLAALPAGRHEVGPVANRILAAKDRLAQARSPRVKATQEVILRDSLERFWAVVSRTPALRADRSLEDARELLSRVDAALEGARGYYNGITDEYNARLARAPTRWLTRGGRLRGLEAFRAEGAEHGTDRAYAARGRDGRGATG